MRTDIAIIGAGIAGATLAAAIGERARVVLLEGEAQPGYHSTGRSAAFWSETYGGPAIQPLTSASGPLLAPWLGPRGGLHLGRPAESALLDAMQAEFPAVRLERVDPQCIIPGLRGDYPHGLAEPTCADIDVAGLHAAALKAAKGAGAVLWCDAWVTGLMRNGSAWEIALADGRTLVADTVVNAAGAWASAVAAMAGAQPIAIQPYRRTVVQLEVDPPAPPDLPLTMDVAGSFYFKPEAGGRLWLSPHDESATDPCDAAPDELDVALAIDRLERAVDWRIVKRERAWAGLRSFAPDRVPVYGWDGRAPGFFWYAGQGGFGIQTAPAAAMIGAALVLGEGLPEPVSGIDVARYAPERFGR
ncbi:NAD(P)/FAD-dependent oxidoreductase [Sphingomonas jatrophae]|uniref:D-arginine dehydrogenase n=1 Tax=Sphingomonas jatrophae TaxID=1166337 RepID=A0A1I6JU56_9SPHN|nr:FAD-binding oxidoreductase [Sphingomonas jatrophae]SFR82492.1 D-arginine dehydrogenase [Sphingomonas jatrophae]